MSVGGGWRWVFLELALSRDRDHPAPSRQEALAIRGWLGMGVSVCCKLMNGPTVARPGALCCKSKSKAMNVRPEPVTRTRFGWAQTLPARLDGVCATIASTSQ